MYVYTHHIAYIVFITCVYIVLYSTHATAGPSITEAVSALLETVFRSLAPQQASLLRLFLLLESREQGREGLGVHGKMEVLNSQTWEIDGNCGFNRT